MKKLKCTKCHYAFEAPEKPTVCPNCGVKNKIVIIPTPAIF